MAVMVGMVGTVSPNACIDPRGGHPNSKQWSAGLVVVVVVVVGDDDGGDDGGGDGGRW